MDQMNTRLSRVFSHLQCKNISAKMSIVFVVIEAIFMALMTRGVKTNMKNPNGSKICCEGSKKVQKFDSGTVNY